MFRHILGYIFTDRDKILPCFSLDVRAVFERLLDVFISAKLLAGYPPYF